MWCILRSARLVSHTIDAPEVNEQPMHKLARLKAQIRAELAALWQADARQVGRHLLDTQPVPDQKKEKTGDSGQPEEGEGSRLLRIPVSGTATR